MSKSKKTNVSLIVLIYAIIFAVLNVIIFVAMKPGKIDNDIAKRAFWFSYGFVALSFLLHFATLFTFDKKGGIDAVFMGLPLSFISIIFFGIETFIGLIFMILGACSVKVPTALVIIIQVIVLAIFLVIALLSSITKNVINEKNEEIKQNVRNIRFLYSDVEIAMEACEDEEIKNELRIFSEDIRYSDPMSIDMVKHLEVNIETVIMEIKSAVYDGNYDLVKSLIKKGKLYLLERNKKIANSK